MTAGRKNSESLSNHWCTPPKYVSAVCDFFCGAIDLDPCSSTHSIVGARVEFQLPQTDGLATSWDYKNVFVNPPYGADRERRDHNQGLARKVLDFSLKVWLRDTGVSACCDKYEPLETVCVENGSQRRLSIRHSFEVPHQWAGREQGSSDVLCDGLLGSKCRAIL